MGGSSWERLSAVSLPEGLPSRESARELVDELLFQRAVQVYIAALPAVNMLSMRDGSEAAFGAGYNVLPVWKDRMNAVCKVTTPNADVIYAMSYLDLAADGPLVVSAPPMVLGMLTDFWQRALTDVGPAGPDLGKGGLYLILPPGYDGPVPGGYHVVRSPTFNVFLFWRAVLTPGKDGPQTAAGVEIIEKTRVFPLRGRELDREPMRFPNASGVAVDMLYPRDATFFDKLATFVEQEPAGMVDQTTRGLMASIGIIKGKPFDPPERVRKILDAAARTAPQMIVSLVLEEALPNAPLYDTGAWRAPFGGVDDTFHAASYLDLDVRAAFFLWAYSSSPAMVVPSVGGGAKYPFAIKDFGGNVLSGGSSYRLHVPAGVPAALYWAVTLYNADDATMIDNGQPFPSRNSLDTLAYNADGSCDLTFGPQLPDGTAQVNWIRTIPGRAFFVLFRLYGPTAGYYDQTWRPGEIEPLR
jgi:hypothetical protein